MLNLAIHSVSEEKTTRKSGHKYAWACFKTPNAEVGSSVEKPGVWTHTETEIVNRRGPSESDTGIFHNGNTMWQRPKVDSGNRSRHSILMMMMTRCG